MPLVTYWQIIHNVRMHILRLHEYPFLFLKLPSLLKDIFKKENPKIPSDFFYSPFSLHYYYYLEVRSKDIHICMVAQSHPAQILASSGNMHSMEREFLYKLLTSPILIYTLQKNPLSLASLIFYTHLVPHAMKCKVYTRFWCCIRSRHDLVCYWCTPTILNVGYHVVKTTFWT